MSTLNRMIEQPLSACGHPYFTIGCPDCGDMAEMRAMQEAAELEKRFNALPEAVQREIEASWGDALDFNAMMSGDLDTFEEVMDETTFAHEDDRFLAQAGCTQE